MRIATWNVNSVKARAERLWAFLERQQPDVLCLQELKLEEKAFPMLELRALGYEAAVYGQKTYNGVAILSREAPADVQRGLDDGADDPQARLIRARVRGLDVLSVYVPNGSTPDSDKFRYKLRWLERLQAYLTRHFDPSSQLVVCGDLNIAPDSADVARPEQWEQTVLCVPDVRNAFQRLLGWGLVDCVRKHHPEGGLYSWWDYRQLGFAKNNGLRIDHILATESVAARCLSARVDRDERKGKRPSDHAPVIVDLG